MSAEVGARPQWAWSDRELFYRNGDRLMVAPIATSPVFSAGTPKVLFERAYLHSGHDYAVLPDGNQFVFIKELENRSGPTEIDAALNWSEELKLRAPSGAK